MKIKFLFILSVFLFATTLKAQEQCQSWTTKDWDNYIQKKLLSQVGEYIGLLRKLEATTAQCPDNVSKNQLGPCLERITGYYGQMRSKNGGMFSAVMSDKDYLASQPADIMELPPELNTAARGLPKNWREIAKKNGWMYVLFHSDTANEPRLVIYLPGKNYDRMLVYYSFDPKNPDPASTFIGLQMQAVEKRKEGKKIDHGKYYFKSWDFSGPDQTPISKVAGGRCVTCHISGPRALVPQKNPAFKTELGGVSSVSEMNELIVHKGTLDYSSYFNEKYFPKNLPVGKSDCMQCHNGKDRQSLAYSVDEYGEFYLENIHRKVLREETMPEENYQMLDHSNRKKIVEDISREYKNEFKKWLTETKCDSSSKSDPSPSSPSKQGIIN